MPICEILDTIPAFLNVWHDVSNDDIDTQIDAWLELYKTRWPDLLQKQLDDYASLNEDWRATAKERIFPALPERLPKMRTAHDNLLKICDDIYGRCQKVAGFDSDLVCVFYFGLGCGAGWATEYGGKPAILFGLENIAEEGWQDQDRLAGLMAHELGHLVHFEWRKQVELPDGDSPWWQLYTEGFAQYCEGILLEKPSWHMQSAGTKHWYEWCQDNQGWLVSEFLRRIDQGEDMRPFFGSWFELRGYKQTGYFLGHEIIKVMREQMSLLEIAMLNDIEGNLRPLLFQLAG